MGNSVKFTITTIHDSRHDSACHRFRKEYKCFRHLGAQKTNSMRRMLVNTSYFINSEALGSSCALPSLRSVDVSCTEWLTQFLHHFCRKKKENGDKNKHAIRLRTKVWDAVSVYIYASVTESGFPRISTFSTPHGKPVCRLLQWVLLTPQSDLFCYTVRPASQGFFKRFLVTKWETDTLSLNSRCVNVLVTRTVFDKPVIVRMLHEYTHCVVNALLMCWSEGARVVFNSVSRCLHLT